MSEPQITTLLGEIDRGGLDYDAGQKLAELVDELQRAALAKKADASGSLTVKLSLKMTPHGAVTISASVSKTTPKIPSMPAIRFAGKGGKLLDAPANQTSLPGIRNPMNDEAS